ncbi:MAG: hypothetical protein M3P32_00205 [Chloroflexota bacterium]|nr:hypothetical protein [Chloroflexota bacterium]
MGRASRSGRATWLVGVVDGLLLGVLGMVFGFPGLTIVVLIVAVSFAVFRSLLLLSGMLVGAGSVWAALMVRQMMLICGEPDRLGGGMCVPSGLIPFALLGAGFVVVGVVVGGVAMRRRRGSED